MILRELSILNYKNISQVELEFSPKINCFIGLNGEGKTNLLDAIYYLSFCKSSNSTLDAQIIRHGTETCALRGIYESDEGVPEIIDCGLQLHHKKKMRRNKKEYKRLSQHLGLIPLVMISPADSLLISGGSEERRKFMDVVISQYDAIYVNSLLRYNKALQQRNVLLKQESEPDASVLDLYEKVMAEEGTKIYQTRSNFISTFKPLFKSYYEQISESGECVDLQYMSQCAQGALLEIIQSGRQKDRIMGYSLHGIHKDDLSMSLGEFPIKKEGSQGQNKTYLIALKLAQFDLLCNMGSHTTPLLLLDDLFDKLDASRVERIIRLVGDRHFGQIFMTDTNREHLDSILAAMNEDYRLFKVKKGLID